jgi:predicted CDP-diglyceride synthetase/phosphatidate cytidylyltransferase
LAYGKLYHTWSSCRGWITRVEVKYKQWPCWLSIRFWSLKFSAGRTNRIQLDESVTTTMLFKEMSALAKTCGRGKSAVSHSKRISSSYWYIFLNIWSFLSIFIPIFNCRSLTN